MDDILRDSRFSHIAKDPRFKTIPRSQRQVKIDKRFQSMFKDKRFKTKYTVDKRGRPVNTSSKEDLERYYAISSESSSSSDESEEEKDDDDESLDESSVEESPEKKDQGTSSDLKQKEKEKIATKGVDKSIKKKAENAADVSSDSDESDYDSDKPNEDIRSDDEELTENMKSKLKDMSVDYARGEGAILSDSSSDESSDDESEEDDVEHGWGELDKDAERSDEITNRLAVCNMDWDRIRAVDLMVLFNSFTPPDGLIHSVAIYVSEFGKERMKQEEQKGPQELVERKDNLNHENENEEGSRYHMEKLRQYQLNRLKYYYAIIECDSAKTANHIYTECDGMEYESSATRLDLRFVPDDTIFDENPHEKCTEVPDSKKYKPRQFTTTALQQAKVELTWDETDPTRAEFTNRLLAGDNVDDNDIKTYLASSSEDEIAEDDISIKPRDENNIKKQNEKNKEKKISQDSDSSSADEEDGEIAKYRLLLADIDEKEKSKKENEVQMEVSWGVGLKEKAEKAVKERAAAAIERTPFQEMMDKIKQKKKDKKAEKLQKKLEASKKLEEENDENPYSDDDIPSDIDMNDPYFAEEFKDGKSATKVSRKKREKNKEDEETEEDRRKKAELELLLMEKDEQKHFNFKKIQEAEELSGSRKKWRNKTKRERAEKAKADLEAKNDGFQVDVDDSRFSALYSSHHYNVDPTDPHFRKSRGMEAIISAKKKKRDDKSDESPAKVSRMQEEKYRKKNSELSQLVKSVKRKTKIVLGS